MGIDAQGYFDIEGHKIGQQELDDIRARFDKAGYWPKRDWFVLCDGFVEINFDLDRYYGPGYERGSKFLEHLTVLGWLLRNLPHGGRVFFGGDCVALDECSEWTLERECEYLDRYLRVGHEPYNRP